ncbi:TrmH family RNA methyltransferase [Patescibacteria group bacterium]
MRDVKIKKYLKKLDYTYVLGIYPTIEMLNVRPNSVIKVLFSTKAQRSQEVTKIKQICRKLDLKYEFNDKLIGKVAHRENTYVVGVLKKYEEKLKADLNHVVLYQPSDMGNMGTIIRTMHAFDLYDLAIIRPGADIFDPRVVRSSMGSLFRIRFSYYYSFNEYKKYYKNHNYYPFLLGAKKTLEEVKFEKPYSLIFGNEGEGLSSSFKDVENTVKIQQSATIDSLNLAISAGIAMYKASVEN